MEQVIAAGNTGALGEVLARKKSADAELALVMLTEKFLKTNTHEWSCLMDNPSMFLTVIKEAQAYMLSKVRFTEGSVRHWKSRI